MVGNSLGLLVVLVLVAFGLGVVVRDSVVVFTVLKFVGAAYLVYLGVQAIRHRRAIDVTAEQRRSAAAAHAPCGRGSWWVCRTRRRT